MVVASQRDLLKIQYLLVLEDESPEDATPFQGFARGWQDLHWAMRAVTTLPADVLERAQDIRDIIAQRMGGVRQLLWCPVNMSALERLQVEQIGLFVVCFSGTLSVAVRLTTWIGSQPCPVLHVSNVNLDAVCPPSAFDQGKLRAHCLQAFARARGHLTQAQIEAAEHGLANWNEPEQVPSGLRALGHKILTPNQMSLARAARSFDDGEPFIGRSEDEYTDVILASASVISAARDDVGVRPFHRMTLLHPALILTEPALFRQMYKQRKPTRSSDERIVAQTLRMLQKQQGLHSTAPGEFPADLLKSDAAQLLISIRQSELETHTLGVGLRAASTFAAVIRLSPGVNHVFPKLSAYARNVRSGKLEARMKSARLFAKIQNTLAQYIGDQRLEQIAKVDGTVKSCPMLPSNGSPWEICRWRFDAIALASMPPLAT